jgi:hypothetical protein
MSLVCRVFEFLLLFIIMLVIFISSIVIIEQMLSV